MTSKYSQWVLLCVMAGAPLAATASIGPFENGSGIKALGMGGVSYVATSETTAMSANPALALKLGRRYDVGVDILHLRPGAAIEGNAIGDDESYESNGRNWYYVPQFGFSLPLNEHWAFGTTLLVAGLGPDYTRSPYARFGGARRASLTLGSGSLVPVLAWEPIENQRFGVGLVAGYQFLDVKGVQFLAAPDGPFRVSTDPSKVTNQGVEGGFSLGYTIGWMGQVAPQISAGVGYRDQVWSQKLDDYSGLLPDQGALVLPAVYGAGVAWKPLDTLTVAFEWQRYEFGEEKAFGNRLSKLSEGNLLGSSDGPGFGLRNQNTWKLGVEGHINPALEWRLGYLRANQAVRRSDTLFVQLAPVTVTTHYTAGFTWTRQAWELSGAYVYCPRKTVHGEQSIPPAFGGGEADVTNQFSSFAVTIGRRF